MEDGKMSDWDDLVEPARGALEALLRKGDAMADRIEALEALYQAAVQDALAAEAYAEELEAKLAKAVDALEAGMSFTLEHYGAAKFLKLARTTLAELKGQNDD
jgi:plasmid stabilization system protein ParE